MDARTDDAPQDEQTQRDATLRFDDPYWDDAFCAWLDPTMRLCCG